MASFDMCCRNQNLHLFLKETRDHVIVKRRKTVKGTRGTRSRWQKAKSNECAMGVGSASWDVDAREPVPVQ